VPNCLVSNFILPGQLILLAFLVETFFFKPAMSFFAPVEKDSSAPRHFGIVEKKCQIGTAFSFKQT
jgi:hypothetical protein